MARVGSSRIGRNCTSCETSARSLPAAGSLAADNGTVTRVPDTVTPSALRSGAVATCRGRARTLRLISGAGKNQDSTSRPPRIPSIRPAPCASHTSRRPVRTGRADLPSAARPERAKPTVDQSASTPSPSSVQRSSCFHDSNAGERSDRIRARHIATNSASVRQPSTRSSRTAGLTRRSPHRHS